jgi:HlyD family secretion protein
MIGSNKPDKNRAFPLTLSPCRLVTLSLLLACGCGDPKPPATAPISLDPTVKVVQAQRRNLTHTVAQPGTIGAYERTAIYGKVSGFVKKWNVDVGDRVKAGQLLVEISAPDIDAQVVEAKANLEQSKATLKLQEANAVLAKTTLARFREAQKEVTGAISLLLIDEQVAKVGTTTASVEAAQASIQVYDAAVLRYTALQGYLKLFAPYDAIVFARNVNLGDFVLPASGDPTQGAFSQGVSPSKSTPLYVLNRIDPVLFIVGVPEAGAPYVAAGTPARVRVPALGAREFTARVTRTSWALNSTSRTLLAQIELPNPKGVFLPGMYAYGSVLIERPDVRALPVSAITQIGNLTYCYLVIEGKAVQTPVETGVSDGSWVEVRGKRVHASPSVEETWVAFDGTEAVIAGNLSEISNDQLVKVDSGK